jgi:hypothetical protein
MSGRIEEGKNEKQVLILLYVDVCVGEKKMVIGKVWNNKDVKNDICLCFRNVFKRNKSVRIFLEYFF